MGQNDYIRTYEYNYVDSQWNNYQREELDNNDINIILKHGGMVYGRAGTGKSTTLNKIKNVEKYRTTHRSIYT